MFSKLSLLGCLLFTAPLFSQPLVLDAVAHDPFGNTDLAIRDIQEDPEGNIWVCGEAGNLAWYDGSRWTKFVVSGFENHDFLTVEIDANAHIWLSGNGVFGSDVLHYNDTSWTSYDSNDDPAFSFVTDIFADSDGTVWMGSPTSLIRFRNSSWDTYNQFDSPLQAGNISNLTPAGNGAVWLTTDQYLTRTDGESSWESYDLYNVVPVWLPPHTQDMDKDDNGQLWLATDKGLISYDGTNFTDHQAVAGRNNYQAIGVDRDGVVWLGKSTYGIHRIEGNQLDSFPADGMTVPSPTITAILVDGNNDKWIAGATGGLMQVSGLKTPIKRPFPEKQISVYPALSSGVFQLQGHRPGATVTVYDLSGKRLTRQTARDQPFHLDLREMVSGWYLLHIREDQNVYVRRVGILK